jgi:uncharacterized protein (DUF433 family)
MALKLRTEHPYVVRIPTIAQGRPLIADTGLTVTALAREIAFGRTHVDIAAAYPKLPLAALHSALSYYYDNQTEIDRDLLLDDLASLGDIALGCAVLRPGSRKRSAPRKLAQGRTKR